MSLVTQITAYVIRAANEFKAHKLMIGGTTTSDVSALNTAATHLVGGINEVKVTADSKAAINDATSGPTTTYSSTKIAADIAAVAGASASIDDVTPSGATVYSSNRTEARLAEEVAALVDSSPAALDTLKELSDALGGDASFAASTAAAIGLKANSADVFTRVDLGTDAVTHDFVADFNAELAA